MLPVDEGVFGPLMAPIPQSVRPLLEEYGANCMQERKVKLVAGGGKCRTLLDVSSLPVRRVAWPLRPLVRLETLRVS